LLTRGFLTRLRAVRVTARPLERANSRLVHHKDTKAPRFRKGWFAWLFDKHLIVSLWLCGWL